MFDSSEKWEWTFGENSGSLTIGGMMDIEYITSMVCVTHCLSNDLAN